MDMVLGRPTTIEKVPCKAQDTFQHLLHLTESS
jgi:hypothetical protein